MQRVAVASQRIGAIVIAVVVLIHLAPAAVAQTLDFVPGQVIVKFKQEKSAGATAQLVADLGAVEIRRIRGSSARILQLRDRDVEETVRAYVDHPDLEYIQPNFLYQATAIPDDEFFADQWHLRNVGQTGGKFGADIRASCAWNEFTGSTDVIVAIIDTGIDHEHPDLAGKVDLALSYDFAEDDADPMDYAGHGTGIAGIIGAATDNATGVAGINWNVTMAALKVFADDYIVGGPGGATSGDVADAIQYAIDIGADIMNNSYGGLRISWVLEGDPSIRDKVEAANAAGVLFVCGAGNDGIDNDAKTPFYRFYPASIDLPVVISVAATDMNDELWIDSNWGGTTVHLAAPGMAIRMPNTTRRGVPYQTSTGTSFSCPQVVGALALMLGADPLLDPLAAKQRLLDNVDQIPSLQGKVISGGRLNLAAALAGHPDLESPAPVADLDTAQVRSNSMDLTWTAVADDCPDYPAAAYDVRYATWPIDDSNFDSAIDVSGEPGGVPVGDLVALRVAGLAPATSYHVGVRAIDLYGNYSPVSSMTVSTLPPQPEIVVAPATLDLGAVAVGGTATGSISVGNQGSDPLTVTLGVDEPAFAFAPANFTVPAGDEQVVTITFAPSQVRAYAGTIIIDSNDPNQPRVTVDLTGQGIFPPEIMFSVTEFDEQLAVGQQLVRTLTFENMGGSDLVWTLDLPGAGTGQKSTLATSRVLHDRSHGQSGVIPGHNALIIELNNLGAYVNESSNPITSESLATWDVLWITGGSQVWQTEEISVVSEWLAGGGSLIIENSASGVGPANSLLAGLGIPITYDLAMVAAGSTGDLSPHPVTLELETVYIPDEYVHLSSVQAPAYDIVQDKGGMMHIALARHGAGRVAAVSMEIFADDYLDAGDNRTLAGQLFGWLSASRWLHVDPQNGVLEPGDRFDLTVDIDATGLSAGEFSQRIRLHTNIPQDPVPEVPIHLSVSGEAQAVSQPGALDFGDRPLEMSSVLPVDLINGGARPLIVTSVSVTGEPFSAYDGGFVLQPEEGRRIEVSFAPAGTGIQTGNLVVESDDPQNPLLLVPLTGSGYIPAIVEVTPAALSREFNVNDTDTVWMTVGNVGALDLDWDIAVGPLPQKTNLTDLFGARILFHNEGGGIQEHLEMLLALEQWDGPNARVSFSGGNRLDTILSKYYHIFWISELPTGFSFHPDDIESIATFVAEGGSVFIEARSSAEVYEYNRVLSAIGASIALEGSPGQAGMTTDIAEHHATFGLTSLVLPAATATLGQEGDEAEVIVRDGVGNDMVALGRVGAGRYVVCADWVLEDNAIAANDDNRAFGVRAMGWLYRGAWLIPQSITNGTLAPGEDVSVPVLIDAQVLMPGSYAAALEFNSNDPYKPRVVIPVTLEVTDPCVALGEVTIGDVQTMIGLCGQTTVSWSTSVEIPCQFTWGLNGSQQTETVQTPSGVEHSVIVPTGQSLKYAGVISATLEECGIYTQEPMSWKTLKYCTPATGVQVPVTTVFSKASPNPFNPITSLVYGLQAPGHVRLRIYDLRGRLVRNLLDSEQPAGWHTVTWEGRDDRGARTASGIYMAVFEAGGVRQYKKLTLLK